MSSQVLFFTPAQRAARLLATRLGLLRSGEVTPTMARREAGRFLAGPRSVQGLLLALLAAGTLCLLIPLHREYGGGSRSNAPYFVIFSVLVQAALFFLGARAVWVSMRHDAATGSLDELLLTGATPSEMLLGKWLGLCLAAAYWTLMLVPILLFAGAFTGAGPLVLLEIGLSWFFSACAGGLAGTLLTLSERTTAFAALIPFTFQAWFVFRWLLPLFGSGLGSFWSSLLLGIRQADPFTLVPAAAGAIHEPWLPKAVTLILIAAAAALWILLFARDLPVRRLTGAKQDAGGLFSLRPVRAWLIGRRGEGSPQYDRDVAFVFERAFGWRLRVDQPGWYALLFPVAFCLVAAILGGRDGHLAGVAFLEWNLVAATFIATLGMAASLASEREQRRWSVLLTTPLSLEQILRGKWQAAWLEAWPLWAAALGEAILLAASGCIPWSGVPVALLAAPLGSGVAAALSAALCVRAPSLTAAQQRAVLLLLLPIVCVFAAGWLLPGLPQLGYASFPHLLASVLQYRPGFAAPIEALAACGGYLVLGAAAYLLAVWQLRRWTPE